MRRLVVRSVNWLGDAVMSSAALIRLREALPEAQIAVLVPQKLAGLWADQPFLDTVLPFSPAAGPGAVSRLIRSGKFDAALILPNSFRSAFEMWLAGVPLRAGFGGRGRKLLLTKIIPRRPGEVRMRKRTAEEVRSLVAEKPEKPRDTFPLSAHQIHDYLRLAAFFGADPAPISPKIFVHRAERERAREKFGLTGGRFIGLNPGAEYGPAKRWPIEYFAQSVCLLHPQLAATWIITGGPGDVEMADRLEKQIDAFHGASPVPLRNLAGKMSLQELRAVLSLCKFVLTNDTGPMHLAAAVGSRVVVPFGSTSPELTGPGLPGSGANLLITGQAPCAPCFLRECPIDFRCMKSIRPADLAEGLTAQIG